MLKHSKIRCVIKHECLSFLFEKAKFLCGFCSLTTVISNWRYSKNYMNLFTGNMCRNKLVFSWQHTTSHFQHHKSLLLQRESKVVNALIFGIIISCRSWKHHTLHSMCYNNPKIWDQNSAWNNSNSISNKLVIARAISFLL